jgi:hypothetical protein
VSEDEMDRLVEEFKEAVKREGIIMPGKMRKRIAARPLQNDVKLSSRVDK